jgi:hypothetical protein
MLAILMWLSAGAAAIMRRWPAIDFHVPRISMLKEPNVRTDVVERDQITGWSPHAAGASARRGVRGLRRMADPERGVAVAGATHQFRDPCRPSRPAYDEGTKKGPPSPFFTDAIERVLEAQKGEHDRLRGANATPCLALSLDFLGKFGGAARI